MSDLLSQALWFTLVGMGMTFAAIGALVLGMYLLTYLFPERSQEEAEVPAPPTEVEEEKGAAREAERRRLAAVAAAAVAVAQASTAPSADEGAGGAVDQWRSFVRSQHLTHRTPHAGYRRR
jgi:Na+-transporting methylmalonyl-CoA/oxaloacetate decarboxylase gamma subunit